MYHRKMPSISQKYSKFDKHTQPRPEGKVESYDFGSFMGQVRDRTLYGMPSDEAAGLRGKEKVTAMRDQLGRLGNAAPAQQEPDDGGADVLNAIPKPMPIQQGLPAYDRGGVDRSGYPAIVRTDEAIVSPQHKLIHLPEGSTVLSPEQTAALASNKEDISNAPVGSAQRQKELMNTQKPSFGSVNVPEEAHDLIDQDAAQAMQSGDLVDLGKAMINKRLAKRNDGFGQIPVHDTGDTDATLVKKPTDFDQWLNSSAGQASLQDRMPNTMTGSTNLSAASPAPAAAGTLDDRGQLIQTAKSEAPKQTPAGLGRAMMEDATVTSDGFPKTVTLSSTGTPASRVEATTTKTPDFTNVLQAKLDDITSRYSGKPGMPSNAVQPTEPLVKIPEVTAGELTKNRSAELKDFAAKQRALGTPQGDEMAARADQERLIYEKQHPYGTAESGHPGFGGKLLHGLSEAAQIAGSAFAPQIVAQIPGTTFNRNIQENKALGRIQLAQEGEQREAQSVKDLAQAQAAGNRQAIEVEGAKLGMDVTFDLQGRPIYTPNPALQAALAASGKGVELGAQKEAEGLFTKLQSGTLSPQDEAAARQRLNQLSIYDDRLRAQVDSLPIGVSGAASAIQELGRIADNNNMTPQEKAKFLRDNHVEPTISGVQAKELIKNANEGAAELYRSNLQGKREADARAKEGRAEDAKVRGEVAKTYSDSMVSAERYNIMTGNLSDALKTHDQQAMLSLLANHLGMTMGLQKGARLNQAIIEEAQKSQPLLAGMKAKFDKDGYLTGVTLSPEQMKSMVGLARERYREDVVKARNVARYQGATDDGPDRTPSKSTAHYYLDLAGGDANRARQMAIDDGWTVQEKKDKGGK